MINELWTRYADSRAADIREAIICHYSDFARILAAKLFAHRQIQEIEFNDYLQYARIGLIESVDRYDSLHGVKFEAFAAPRIKGAVLNGIEKHSEQQQQITMRARLRKERLDALSAEGDSPQLSLFEKLMDVAIGLAIGSMLEDSSMYETDKPKQIPGAYERVEYTELCQLVRRLVELLPEQQKKIVKYFYFYGYRVEKIAEEMHLTKGRVSQIHKQALQSLRNFHKECEELNRSI